MSEDKITDLALSDLAKLCEQATPAPWFATWTGGTGYEITQDDGTVVDGRGENAEFIAAARINLPLLLAEIRRLRATERQYTVGRQRIADLMGWCARELGASHVHEKIREYLAIPDAAYPWQLPHPEHPAGGEVPVESAPAAGIGDIHDAIDLWHEGAGEGQPLHEYLGMTWDEYRRWAESSVLPEGSRWRDSAAADSIPLSDQAVYHLGRDIHPTPKENS